MSTEPTPLGGRCGTCRHWTQEFSVNDLILRGRLGDAFAAYGECALMGSTDCRPDVADPLAFATDPEGWTAGLVTKAAFGCVQWAAQVPP